jgi:outer membrane lipoprotein SlyB
MLESRFARGVTIAAFAAVTVALSGCARSLAGDTYQRGQTMQAQTVELGVIESLRPVNIEGRQSGAGTVGGAALGGIAGSTIGGSSSAHAAGAIAGAIVGGLIGNAIERDATRANGVELTVRLDNGRMLAVVQESHPNEFRPGDRVRVLSDRYMTRVTR